MEKRIGSMENLVINKNFWNNKNSLQLTIKDFQGEVYSGKVMQLIKQTLENIRLGKQQQTNGEKNGTVQYMVTDSTIKR